MYHTASLIKGTAQVTVEASTENRIMCAIVMSSLMDWDIRIVHRRRLVDEITVISP